MSAPHQQEDDEVPFAPAMGIFIATVVLGVGLCLVAWLFLYLREAELRPSHKFPERELGPPHRVSEIRQEPFEAVHHQDHPTGLRRIDATHARIPIDLAMELVVLGVRP